MTWIPAAYRFTRHDPYDYGAIDYLIDSGHVLKKLSWPELSDGVERCREVVRGVLDRRAGISTLADVVGDAEVASLAAALEETATNLFPAGFRSLVLFCRWKELFHGWREAVDLQALGSEAQKLVAAGIDLRSVRESLWLLGCFAGHERVAPMRYAAEGHAWWCGENLAAVKITGPAGTVRADEVSGESGEQVATEPETVGDGASPGGAGAQPVATEAKKGPADEVSGEPGEPVATARPATVGAGEASGESGEQAAAAAKPATVGDGALSGEPAGEAEEPARAAAKPVEVGAGALSGGDGDPAVAAEEAEKGPGRLPFEPSK